MCVIIVNKEGKKLPNGVVAQAMSINPDGFGIAYLDGDKEVIKTMDYTEAFDHVQSGRPYVAHFRYTTRGATNESNCHPFPSGDGVLFHNGTIRIETKKGQVDSEVIADLVGDMDPVKRKKVLELTDSRFVRVTDGQVEIYNEDLFINHHGVLYSKNNVLAGKLVGVYGTLRKGFGNHSYLANAKFVGSGKTFDRYRMTASGVPFLLQGPNADGAKHVTIEVYSVNEWQLKSLDRLEGHPTWYKREKIGIRLDNGIVIGAEVYIINDVSRHDDGKYYADFADVRPPVYKYNSFQYGTSNVTLFSDAEETIDLDDDFDDEDSIENVMTFDEEIECPDCLEEGHSVISPYDEYEDAYFCGYCEEYKQPKPKPYAQG